MSNGISAEVVGAGVLPDMSMPPMFPEWASVVELADASFEPWLIPAMSDDVDLPANNITATTPATARTTAEATNRRIPVGLFIKVRPKVVALR